MRVIKRTFFNITKLFPLLFGAVTGPRARRLGALLRDLVLLGWDQVVRAAPHVKRLARRSGAFVRDLALLGWDQVVARAPAAKRLASRAGLLARKHLVLPARNLVILMALAIVCVGFAQTGPGHSVLSGMGLYQPPVVYTELTFAAPDNLPGTLATAHSPVDVSFDIHNVSGASRAYHWFITVAKNGHNGRQAAAGTVTAAAQGRVTVTRSVTAACTSGRLQFVVRLASPAESVEFWVTCPVAVLGAR